MNYMPPLTNRPRELTVGAYTATVKEEEPSPWGPVTTWIITREGIAVGKMFQGTAGYGERPTCSMSVLVWAGKMPKGASDTKSPEYGMGFDIGPHDTRELALAEFGRRADRLIAWREKNP